MFVLLRNYLKTLNNNNMLWLLAPQAQMNAELVSIRPSQQLVGRFGTRMHTESTWRSGTIPTTEPAKSPTFNSRHFRRRNCTSSLWANDEGGPRNTAGW